MKSCIVIGGGLGGLVTGALLAKEGYRITVLEKNAIIGGGLQTFKRNGVNFPTGMHVFGGFNQGENLHKIFSYLGVMDKISLCPTDDKASDVVTFGADGKTYRLPKGKGNYIQYLTAEFPEEKENIKAYIGRLFEISQEEDLFYLRESAPESRFSALSEDFTIPYNELIDKYITNHRLKELLGYLQPLFGGKEGMTPAFLNALPSVLHINGTCQFVGGSQQLAEALKTVIEKCGGQVLSNEEVVGIGVENQMVTKVSTRNGNTYFADSYISDIHPQVLLRVIDEGAFSTAFKKRMNSIPESASSFKVYVKFKEKAFPYLNHANYFIDNQKNWPERLFYVTPPIAYQGDFAETMVIISEMGFEQVRRWEHTQTGHRGKDYEQWKQEMMEKVIKKMENLHPGFREAIEFSLSASPLTIRDYYGNKEGSNYGFQKDSHNLMLSQMSVFTKVKNLFLTGQNVNIHGLCGVSLTAIETAEALVGHNVIVHKINNFWLSHP